MTTINTFLHASVYGTYFFYIKFAYFHNLFHLTNVCILCRAHAFICWVTELFFASKYTNIAITRSFFLFRCTWGLFLALNIICTQSFRMSVSFIVACTHYVGALQLFFIQWNNICFVDMSKYFVDTFFQLTSKLNLLVRIVTCFFPLILLEICFIRKK